MSTPEAGSDLGLRFYCCALLRPDIAVLHDSGDCRTIDLVLANSVCALSLPLLAAIPFFTRSLEQPSRNISLDRIVHHRHI